MTNTNNTQVEVNLTDLHLIDNDMTFDFCESDIKVKICLYRTKDFATKYGKRVKALGGTFTHCRGHNYDRWVTLPAPFFREVREGHPAPFAAEVRELERLNKLHKLINEMLTDSALWASPACDPMYRDFEMRVPCQWSDGTGHMIVLKRWGNPVIAKTWFALTLRHSRDMLDSLQKTGKAVFNRFTGCVRIVESNTGYITDDNAEWGFARYEKSIEDDTEAPAEDTEATEDTNTTPDMPSEEERDSDAFKAFATKMKALLADVPEALPADMLDAHTLLCVQFAVDKRQHKPCKQYEWGSEFAQCGAELTIQQGIMQFTVPLQTSRQRELFKTLHECSILDDPEMSGARQYLFTQVVLPLARWGCTAQPQVNTALVECMYYEGAGAIIKAGYIACTSKLQ